MPLPTDAELEILRVLWRVGPCTVRHVHEVLGGDTTYTTTLKLLQNMHAKGLVRRDERSRQHVYRPVAREGATLDAVVRRLADRLFGGSAAALALRALGDERMSLHEIAQLKQFLRERERERADATGETTRSVRESEHRGRASRRRPGR